MILDEKYKTLDALSNSAIKYFAFNSPWLYFTKYIDPLRPVEPEFSTESTDIGDLVDCYITTPELFTKFYYVSGDVKCSPDVKAILNAVHTKVKYTEMEDLNMKEKMLKDLRLVSDVIITIARKHISTDVKTGEPKTGYRNNYTDPVLIKYFEDVGKSYYEDLGVAGNRKIIDMSTNTKAKESKCMLEDDAVIGPMLKQKSEDGIIIHTQWMITATINGFPCKILVDWAIEDTIGKIIYPKDIKTAYSQKQFLINSENFLYPLQGAFYSAILQAAFPDYKIAPFEFIVTCTDSGEDPMIYRLSNELFNMYTTGAGRFKGWMNILNEIKWHTDNNIWRFPKTYYENQYIMLGEGDAGIYKDPLDQVF